MEKLILALDVASKVGFCVGKESGEILESGSFDTKKGNSDKKLAFPYEKTEYLSKFEDLLLLLKGKYGYFNSIVYEMSQGAQKSAIIHQAEMHGIMKLFCNKNNSSIRNIPPKTHKKYITGNGNAEKIDSILAINKRYGLIVEDDNEADAISVFKTMIAINNGEIQDKVRKVPKRKGMVRKTSI